MFKEALAEQEKTLRKKMDEIEDALSQGQAEQGRTDQRQTSRID